MRQEHYSQRANGYGPRPGQAPYSPLAGSLTGLLEAGAQMPRQVIVGVILVLALFAFEMFNFDTTRYALENLLGPVSFLGLGWSTILAVAFCSIDFAGLVRLFTPGKGSDAPKEAYYLMGAWLLGATMNAMMTWWAVSLTLISHDFGNEVMSREQLLRIVPIFVAVLVWLTRILFIGAFAMAGEKLMSFRAKGKAEADRPAQQRSMGQPLRSQPVRTTAPRPRVAEELISTSDDMPAFLRGDRRERMPQPAAPAPAPQPRPVQPQVQEPLNIGAPEPARRNDRVRQRPPVPGANGPVNNPANGVSRTGLRGVSARGRNGVG
jgi:hypothetical protein